MFGFEKEKILTAALGGTAVELKRTLRGRRETNRRKGRFCL